MATVAHAELAITRAVEGDDVVLSAAAALAGLASWSIGDLDGAHRGYSTAVDGLRRAGHVPDVLGCSITLADIRITQGRLGDAVRTFEDGLALAAQEPGPMLRGTPDMLVGLSRVALERNDLDAASELLTRAEEPGEHLGLPQHPYRLRVARARLLEVHGDLAGAVALLEEAERVYDGDFSPNVRPVPAMRARLLVKQGRLSEALDWARDNSLSADDDLSYVREYEHVTLSRILLAQHTAARIYSRGWRSPPRTAAGPAASSRSWSCKPSRTPDAGDAALDPLERALRLAEPEGYVRVFVDEGAPLRALLAALAKKHPTWSYPRRLLQAYGDPATAPVQAGLVDPLSARELDVLRLLASDLDGPAIARELVVSLNTVRTHTKNIYAKLGVNSRREAVTRAGELDLLSRSRG